MQSSHSEEKETPREETSELNVQQLRALIGYLRNQRDSEDLKVKKAAKQNSHKKQRAATREREARGKPPRRTRNTFG